MGISKVERLRRFGKIILYFLQRLNFSEINYSISEKFNLCRIIIKRKYKFRRRLTLNTFLKMNTTFHVSQQAKDFADLTNKKDKNTFLNSQKEAFLLMSSEEKLEHFRAIQQRTEELKYKIQKHSFA